MKIIVTGGAGFIGSHTVDRLLAEDHEVLVIDDFSLGKKAHLQQHVGNAKFSLVEANLTDQVKTDRLFAEFGPECVFHLAANSDIGAGAYDFGPDLKKTFGTTIAVLEAMKKAKIKKLVFASTSAIYGSKKDTVSETTGPLIPESNYGAGKLASEAFISAFAHTNDIEVWIFRFPNVCGPRATHGVFFNFLKFLAEDPTAITVAQDGTQAKPYIYVTDLVNAVLLGWKEGKEKFNVFNIGNQPLVSVNEILSFLLKEKGIENIKINYTGAPAWPGDVPTYTFDDAKIRALGYVPTCNSTEACMRTAKDLVEASK